VYQQEESIILKDRYHKSTYEQATGLSSIPFGWIGEPQVLTDPISGETLDIEFVAKLLVTMFLNFLFSHF
jgi:hypothetical protein